MNQLPLVTASRKGTKGKPHTAIGDSRANKRRAPEDGGPVTEWKPGAFTQAKK